MTFPYRLASGNAPRMVVFDLDETLLAADSTRRWTDWLYETGTTTDPVYREATERMAERYRLGTLDIRDYLFEMAPAVAHLTPEALDLLIERFIESRILPDVYPEGRALIAAAREAGLPMAIISATASFLVRPIARRLGITTVMGVDLVLKNGLPTGRVDGIPTFREGKVLRLTAWLNAFNGQLADNTPPLTLNDVFFFTDSRNDLPLARAVGGCALVNPDPVIRAEGLAKGWPILGWKVAKPIGMRQDHRLRPPRDTLSQRL